MANRITKRCINSAVAVIGCLLLLNTGCATNADRYNDRQKCGVITAVTGTEITFIMGCKERVKMGQVLNVVSRMKAWPGFTRQCKTVTMGVVQITGFPDDRTATAKILYGTIKKEYMVQL